MAILGKEKSQIEVRLYKLPKTEPKPTYFDEYAPLSERDKSEKEITRYIVPEDTRYGIEVTFKAGFVHGKFNDTLGVELWDATSDRVLYNEYLESDEHCIGQSFKSDVVYHITTLPEAVVMGKPRCNVGLSFSSLLPEEFLGDDSNNVNCLSGIEVRVRRSSKYKEVRMSDGEWQVEIDRYNALKAGRSDTITTATTINQTLFHKEGLTHGLKLIGGSALDKLEEPSRYANKPDHVSFRKYTFLCRTKEYLERSSIVMTPIATESQPWNCLTEEERKSSFRLLQDYDRDHTLKQKIAEAGIDADTLAIRKQLFESDELPNRWRGWQSLLKREREGQFNKLQFRRNFFEKGEYPPEASSSGQMQVTTSTVLVNASEAKSISLDSPSQAIVKEELKDGDGGQATATPSTASENATGIRPMSQDFESHVSVKEEPNINPPPRAVAEQPSQVIVLDESDEEAPPYNTRRTSSPSTGRITVKTEPVGEHVNSHPIAREIEVLDDRPSKKIKLEPVAASSFEDESELFRLEEEDERKEEELAAAQKVAQLLHERNLRKAKIADLKAKSAKSTSRASNGV